MAFLNHNPLIKRSIIFKKTINPRSSLQMNVNGLDLGIPLNIITNVFTNLHYGYDITTPKLILLQFLIGYYSYGKDRYKDALEYELNPYETNKEDFYQSILKYKYNYKYSYCLSFYMIIVILCTSTSITQAIPIIGLLYSTEYYKLLKEKNAFYKPFYVSFMWTFATIIMPCILYEHNYEILYDFYDYVPCMLLLFSSTNLADIKDIEEDKQNEILTLPVQYGEENTIKIVFGSLALSSLLFGLHPNYLERPIINSLFELQNTFLSVITYYVFNLKFKSR